MGTPRNRVFSSLKGVSTLYFKTRIHELQSQILPILSLHYQSPVIQKPTLYRAFRKVHLLDSNVRNVSARDNLAFNYLSRRCLIIKTILLASGHLVVPRSGHLECICQLLQVS
jgi:hypothetical protein